MRRVERLMNERDQYWRQAGQHASAAKAAEEHAGRLRGQISALNARIQAVRGFLKDFVDKFDKSDGELTERLGKVGDSAAQGIDVLKADCDVKKISAGNAGIISGIRGDCQAIIGRLGGQIDSLNSQVSQAQAAASSERSLASRYSEYQAQVQRDLDACF